MPCKARIDAPGASILIGTGSKIDAKAADGGTPADLARQTKQVDLAVIMETKRRGRK
jgi:hypothetical protein